MPINLETINSCIKNLNPLEARKFVDFEAKKFKNYELKILKIKQNLKSEKNCIKLL